MRKQRIIESMRSLFHPKKKAKIKIATDFSENPSGRYKTDGLYSAESFREDYLVPYLRNNDIVKVDIEGVYGFSSSFLDEAFGELSRYFDDSELVNKLKIVYSSKYLKTYEKEIWLSILE